MRVQGSSRSSEPQPPSVDDLDLRAPAPPDEPGPQPPAAPDPLLLEAFEKDPAGFPSFFAQWQETRNEEVNGGNREKRQLPRGETYDQFLTAAIVSGVDIQRSYFTFFAPSDVVLQKLNVSLPVMALQDKDCVTSLVRYASTVEHDGTHFYFYAFVMRAGLTRCPGALR